MEITKSDLATEAKQDDAITLLTTIDADTGSILTTQTDNTQTTNIIGIDYVAGKSGIDASTETLQTITYEHHEIHSGSHYFVVGYQDLVATNVLDFTWQMPASTKETHWVWSLDTDAETLWQVYENVVATNPLANTVTPYNSDRNSGNTSGTTMKYELQANLAAANADTNVSGGILLESGKSGAGKKNSGNAIRSNELILDQGVLYCLRATSIDSGYINFSMRWYEHESKN